IRYSLFDMMSIIIRKAGQALARHKEQKVADIITAGDIVLDNSSTTYKSSTGRNIAGAYNGTLTLDDIHYAYGIMIDKGFTPNTLIIHPLAWNIFANEGIARAFGFQNGLAPLMWQLAQGQPGNVSSWAVGGNKLNNLTYATAPGEIATTHTTVPNLFPLGLRIIVSPYMTFNSTTNRTNIALCDVNELGVLVVDEDIVSDEWEDKARDLRKVKFRERYAVADMNLGKGIAMLNDIYIGEGNFDFMDKAMLNISGVDITGSLTGDRSHTTNV
ncbi:MAG: phage major capsid protein, partial [Candidatus Thorarchaeota archaeon]